MAFFDAKTNRKIIVGAFLSVPILASIISTLHIVQYLMLGNPGWMSIFLSVTFEVGSIASFLALSVIDRIKKTMIIFIFLILFLMQVIGNVYFSFDYCGIKIHEIGSWLNTFVELMKPIFAFEDQNTYRFLLSLLIGLPVPLVSLAFLKSLTDYLSPDDKEKSSGLIESNVPVLDVTPKDLPSDELVMDNIKSVSKEPVIPNQDDINIRDDDPALYQTVQ